MPQFLVSLPRRQITINQETYLANPCEGKSISFYQLVNQINPSFLHPPLSYMASVGSNGKSSGEFPWWGGGTPGGISSKGGENINSCGKTNNNGNIGR